MPSCGSILARGGKIQYTINMARHDKKHIEFKASDGFEMDGLLLPRDSNSQEELLHTPIVMIVHGELGHFLSNITPRLLPSYLFDNGISSFAVNTRMANIGQKTGQAIVDDAIMDIEAAVDLLKDMGFQRIYILGYSLGSNLAVYYASECPNPSVKGIMLEGCTYSLPDSHKKRLNKWGSIPSYDQIYEKAKEILSPDPYTSLNDTILVVSRAWGPTLKPGHFGIFTYRTWWFMKGPEATKTKAYKLISKVKMPILFLRGANDRLIENRETTELADIANKAGNFDVTIKYIPDARHDCMENPGSTTREIVGWISSVNSP